MFPEFAAPVGAYAMVGMRSVVAGTTPATLQAIVMAPEMTKNYEMILPLALHCAIWSLMKIGINSSVATLESICSRWLIA